MPNREDIRRDQTFKDQCDDDGRRVYYTLTDERGDKQHRIAKAVSLLVTHLQSKNLIDDDELDELLLNVVQ
jgi:hypothetical protein